MPSQDLVHHSSHEHSTRRQCLCPCKRGLRAGSPLSPPTNQPGCQEGTAPAEGPIGGAPQLGTSLPLPPACSGLSGGHAQLFTTPPVSPSYAGSAGSHVQLSTTPPAPLPAAAALENTRQGLRNASCSPQRHKPVSHKACAPEATGALCDSDPARQIKNTETSRGMSQACIVLRNRNGAVSVSTWSDMGVQRTVTYSSAADVASALVAKMEDAPPHLRDAFRIFCVDAKASILFLSQTCWETKRRAGTDPKSGSSIDHTPRVWAACKPMNKTAFVVWT